MRHGKRSVLTTEDINAALRLRNVEVRPARSARRAAHALGLRLAHPFRAAAAASASPERPPALQYLCLAR